MRDGRAPISSSASSFMSPLAPQPFRLTLWRKNAYFQSRRILTHRRRVYLQRPGE